MYAFTSFWFVNRTRATFLIAEFGFFGVVVYTRTHTPRRCGHDANAADLLVLVMLFRPFLTSCDIVGIACFTYDLLRLDNISPLKRGRKSTRLNFLHNGGFINFFLKSQIHPLSHGQRAFPDENFLRINKNVDN
jgi:hypothetical protein